MLNKLLRKGFLPQEIPSLFTSELFAAYIRKTQTLPQAFTKNKAPWAQQVDHNLLRVGGARRRLGIPNPINFYRIAKVFDDNQLSLEQAWDESDVSCTKPNTEQGAYRAISPESSNRAEARAKCRTGARYLLKADIAQFYPSIYTHSIPWRVHTKAVAKRNRRNSLYGNKLDAELQASNFGQTKGIAIGPDTSLGVAELLLSKVDAELKSKTNMIAGCRFIDDMEYSFANYHDAQHALAVLETLLLEYELQLNMNKTEIIVLPDIIESKFVSELRHMIPESTTKSKLQWIDYFNKAFELQKLYPKEGVIRYAVAACKNSVVEDNNWELVQHLLWQSAQADPGAMKSVIDILLFNRNPALGLRQIDSNIAIRVLDDIIVQASNASHHSEVFWALLSFILLGIKVPKSSVDCILEVNDDFVAVLAKLAQELTYIDPTLESALWKSWIVTDSFYSEHWLFVYEAYFNDWYSTEVANADIDKVAECKEMKVNGVTFINRNYLTDYKPQQELNSYTSGGGY